MILKITLDNFYNVWNIIESDISPNQKFMKIERKGGIDGFLSFFLFIRLEMVSISRDEYIEDKLANYIADILIEVSEKNIAPIAQQISKKALEYASRKIRLEFLVKSIN